MTDGVTSELLPRKKLIEQYGFSDSSERRGRREGEAWPPHVVIGHKIYYRRHSVEQWLADQERASLGTRQADVRALFLNLDENINCPAQDLVDHAPSLSREHVDSIQTLIAGGHQE